MQMGNALTVKGQVTIPKRVRDALGLKPGDKVDFVVSEGGTVAVRRADPRPASAEPDRFDRAVGTAQIPLGCSVDEYMNMIRGED
jgi:AbrB family looped-hinge helix DNA binding protein